MKNYEALELQAKAMRLVEGTEFGWMAAIRLANEIIYDGTYELGGYSAGELELALAIVEGKPVFKGDELWKISSGKKYTIASGDGRYFSVGYGTVSIEDFSWSPPKPKTVMVELLVEDAESLSVLKPYIYSNSIAHACRKALGELK